MKKLVIVYILVILILLFVLPPFMGACAKPESAPIPTPTPLQPSLPEAAIPSFEQELDRLR